MSELMCLCQPQTEESESSLLFLPIEAQIKSFVTLKNHTKIISNHFPYTTRLTFPPPIRGTREIGIRTVVPSITK